MALDLVPRGLLHLLAVAEHGSVQAASWATGIFGSAIARRIVLLEGLGELARERRTA